MKVSVASKREETLLDAPGIVGVILKDKIRGYGANTLIDLLIRLPNVYFASAGNVQDTNINIRAVSSGAINKQLLIMLNGRPLRDPKAGGINSLIYKSFPLDTLEKIEIIRGPGSVLYGTSAFAGVINLITKSPQHNDSPDILSIKTGSNGKKLFSLSLAGHHNDFAYNIAGQFDKADGLGGFHDDSGFYSDESMEMYDRLFSGQFYYKKFQFNALLGRERTLTPRFRVKFPLRQRDRERAMLDVGYQHDFNDDSGKLTANIMYSEQKSYDNNVDLVAPSKSIQTEINYFNSFIDDKLNLLIGTTYERLRGQHNINSLFIKQRWWNLYTQADYRPSDDIKLIAGIQMNDPGNTSVNYSPRFGLIYYINESYSIKTLYSEAFRSPSIFEQGLQTRTVTVADDDLGPETIKTTDIQLNYSSKRANASLTFYDSTERGAIRFRSDQNNPGNSKFQNFGKTTFHGIELEGEYKISDNWSTEASLTYQKNKEFGIEDVQLIPNFMAKLGFHYDNNEGIRAGIFNHFFGTPNKAEDIIPTTPVTNPAGEAYNHLTLNIDIMLNNFIDLPQTIKDTSISLYGDNLLKSDKVFSPDFNRHINTFPIHHDRSFYVKLHFPF